MHVGAYTDRLNIVVNIVLCFSSSIANVVVHSTLHYMS